MRSRRSSAGSRKAVDADGHALVALRGLGPIGAEQPVPPREIEAEIAVGLGPDDGVVDAVHVGRHHEPADQGVDGRGHAHIRVIEHRGGVEQDLENQHGQRRRADCRHHGELDQNGEHDLDRMEAHAGRHIDVEIGVVHAMQPPQHRHGVEQHVLEIDGKVEHQHRHQDRHALGQRQPIEETPAARLARKRHAHRRRRKEDADDEGVERDDAQVARPAPAPPKGELPLGPPQLPQRHDGENARESGKAGPRLVGQQDLDHGAGAPAPSEEGNPERQTAGLPVAAPATTNLSTDIPVDRCFFWISLWSLASRRKRTHHLPLHRVDQRRRIILLELSDPWVFSVDHCLVASPSRL